MKVTVANLTVDRISLPTGQVLAGGGSATFNLEDGAYYAVEAGETDNLSKDIQKDVDVLVAIKALEIKGVVSSTIVGYRAKQIIPVSAGWNGAEPWPATLTVSVTGQPLFLGTRAGSISKAALFLNDAGTDTNPLSAELDIEIVPYDDTNSLVSIFTTKPKITKDATGPCSTLVAGTGVRVGVIDPTVNSFRVGDFIIYSINVVRTATPSGEMTGATIAAELDMELGITGTLLA